ncbi:NYN domain-containing protein [Dehalococcoidia bacterium]|nr:NYN domain-containing protein [Dehalococcoidia bacterium]
MVTLHTDQRLAEPTVAVLIDYENVGLDTMQYLFDQLSDVGRVIVKRAYADWSVHRSRRDQLLEFGIEAEHYFHNTKSGKNSSDICLVIDAVDLLHNASIDTFVIVSADSDFVPLVNKLRGAGKVVVGAGRRDAASSTLVRSCDRYINLDDATDRSPPQSGPTSVPRSRSGNLVVRALEASQDGQGQVHGSRLHQAMLRIDPAFNFKGQGYSTFSRYLESRPEVHVTRRRDADDMIVQLDGPRSPSSGAVLNSDRVPDWDRGVDEAWTRRHRNSISGQAAATDVARVIGAPNLKSAGFSTLDKVLGASDHLRSRWRREGNTVVRR